jgi:FkbM family methyltransferase
MSFWQKISSSYVRRVGATEDGVFEAYAPGCPWLGMIDWRRLAFDPVWEGFIQDWVTPEATVWDIGAGFGQFAFAAALKAKQGKVYAFESDVDMIGRTRHSLRLSRNKGLNISLLFIAVTGLDITEQQLRPAHRQTVARKPRRAPGLTIDTLAKKRKAPSILNIRAKGDEAAILEGGRKTVARNRPMILMEVSPECSGLGTFFREFGYVMLDAAGDRGQPLNQPVPQTLAVPSEKYEHSALGCVHRVLSR